MPPGEGRWEKEGGKAGEKMGGEREKPNKKKPARREEEKEHSQGLG